MLWLTPIPRYIAYDSRGQALLVLADHLWAAAREVWVSDPVTEADLRQWVPADKTKTHTADELAGQAIGKCYAAFWAFLCVTGKTVGILSRLPVTDNRLDQEMEFAAWAARLFEEHVTSRFPMTAPRADLIADLVGIARDLEHT